MNAQKFWEKVDMVVKAKGITLGYVCSECGLNQRTFYQQRLRGVLPKTDIVCKMERILGVSLTDGGSNEWDEYITYLQSAQQWQLLAVRQILGMPEKKSSESSILVG